MADNYRIVMFVYFPNSFELEWKLILVENEKCLNPFKNNLFKYFFNFLFLTIKSERTESQVLRYNREQSYK